MKLHTEVLQVLPAPVPTDWFAVAFNVIAIFLSVYLGYKLSERQRIKIEKGIQRKDEIRELEQTIKDQHSCICYAQGVLSAQTNCLNNWIAVVIDNEFYSKRFDEQLLLITTIEFDYRYFSKILHIFPDLIVKSARFSAGINNINSVIEKQNQFLTRKNGKNITNSSAIQLDNEYYKLFTVALELMDRNEALCHELWKKAKEHQVKRIAVDYDKVPNLHVSQVARNRRKLLRELISQLASDKKPPIS